MRGRTNLPQLIVTTDKQEPGTPGNPLDLGLKWKPNALQTLEDFIKVIYEYGHFAAVTKMGSLATSVDGKNWRVTKLGEFTVKDFVYIDGLFFIVGYKGKCGLVATSRDLQDWNIKDDIVVPEDVAKASGVTFSRFETYVYDSDEIMSVLWSGSKYMFSIKHGYLTTGNVTVPTSYIITFTIDSLESTAKTVGTTLVNGTAAFKAAPFGIFANNRFVVGFGHGQSGETYVSSDGTSFEKSKLAPYFTYIEGYFYEKGLTKKSINGIDVANNFIQGVSGYEFLFENFMIDSKYVFFTSHGSMAVLDKVNVATSVQSEQNKCVISQVTNLCKIMAAAKNENMIVLVGEKGTIFTAEINSTSQKLLIVPETVNKEIPIFARDNIRLLKVKAVNKMIDANIKPENIKEGVSILGVTGTYKQQV